MQACLGHALPSIKRDEDENYTIQEAAVNLAILLSTNPTMTNFPSVEIDNNHHHTTEEAKKLLHEIVLKKDNNNFRWNVQLKERLHEVLLSMN